jgi:hypothetical protein
VNKITNPGRRTWIHGKKGINEKNKNKQVTKEFDKEDLEEVGGQSQIAVRDAGHSASTSC